MKRTILVGILAQSFEHSHGVRRDYSHFIKQIEHHIKCETRIIFITPEVGPSDVKLDLLLLPGGADLSTSFQRVGYCFKQGNDDSAYTAFADLSLKEWVDAGTPIFGICLGFQMLVNHLGGKLTHHMDNHAEVSHPIVVRKDTELGLPSSKVLQVNSRHHQGYMLASFLKSTDTNFVLEFKPLAFSVSKTIWSAITYKGDDSKVAKKIVDSMLQNASHNLMSKEQLDNFPDGTVIEAFRCRSQKIAGVQWHPEDLTNEDNISRGDELTIQLIKWLLSEETDDNIEDGIPVVESEENSVEV